MEPRILDIYKCLQQTQKELNELSAIHKQLFELPDDQQIQQLQKLKEKKLKLWQTLIVKLNKSLKILELFVFLSFHSYYLPATR